VFIAWPKDALLYLSSFVELNIDSSNKDSIEGKYFI